MPTGSRQVDQPVTSTHGGEPGAGPGQGRITLGGAALLCTIAGFVLFLGTIGAIEWVTRQEQPSVQQPRRAPAPPLAQALLFVVGSCAGGIFSVVALGLAAWSLRRWPRTLALWALAGSLLTLALVVAWYLARHAEVRLGS
jgi:hypothetical protein